MNVVVTVDGWMNVVVTVDEWMNVYVTVDRMSECCWQLIYFSGIVTRIIVRHFRKWSFVLVIVMIVLLVRLNPLMLWKEHDRLHFQSNQNWPRVKTLSLDLKKHSVKPNKQGKGVKKHTIKLNKQGKWTSIVVCCFLYSRQIL